MAERLTTRFHGILVKEADVSKIQVITKLGQLEDIMDKYGIESAEELDNALFQRIVSIDNPFVKGYVQAKIDAINRAEQDRDTWKRACELACDVLRDINYKIYNEDRIDFENTFYQQAKKEKENENDDTNN